MEAITLIKAMDSSVQWTLISSDNPAVSEDTLSSINKGGKVVLEVREDAPYRQHLHDTALPFHAVYGADLSGNQQNISTNVQWNVRDKKLFLFTRNPQYLANDWSDGMHTTVKFCHGKEAIHLRILSIILHGVSPEVEMRIRQIRGSLSRTKFAIGRISEEVVSYISEVCGLAQNHITLVRLVYIYLNSLKCRSHITRRLSSVYFRVL